MNLLSIVLVIVSIILIVLVLLQQRGDMSGFLGAGGGGGGGDFYQKRRGSEKTMYTFTIILIILFASLAVGNLFLNSPSELPNEANQAPTDQTPLNETSGHTPTSETSEAPVPSLPSGSDLGL